MTVDPLSACSPPGGFWAITFPLIVSDFLTTVSVLKPAFTRVACALASSLPTTLGTVTCSVLSTSSNTISSPTAATAPPAKIHQRRPGPSSSPFESLPAE
uniref:Unannotated protein n=1 Tax=freshwater metagenome TaxID=449393 RepID=A0A6J5ZQD6_9ZZZZ